LAAGPEVKGKGHEGGKVCSLNQQRRKVLYIGREDEIVDLEMTKGRIGKKWSGKRGPEKKETQEYLQGTRYRPDGRGDVGQNTPQPKNPKHTSQLS